MNRNTFRCLTISALLLVLNTGCASLSGPQQQTKIRHSEVQARLVEANSALDAVTERSSSFYTQLGSTLQQIRESRGRPGWNEFEQILLEYASLRDADNEIVITPEIESRLAQWSRRWNRSWEQTLTGYHDLVDRCIILEAKRLAVRERLLAVQAKFLAAVMLEVAAGREKEGKDIYAVVEMLDRSGTELDSYQPDDLGLYGSAASSQ